MPRRAVLSLGICLLMALSACGGDDSGGAADTTTPATAVETTVATTVVSTTAAPPSTTTTVAEGPIDVSTADVPPSPVTGPFAEGDLQLEGDIVAAWYVTGEVWAVYYDGLAEEVANGKCLGTALVKAGGVVHETSSPYGALACQGFVTEGEILPPGSVHRCAEQRIFYTSTISISEDGVLAAAIDKVDDTGGSQSLTSEAAADPTDVPELDFSGCQVIS